MSNLMTRWRYACPVRLTILVAMVFLAPVTALADARVMLSPGPGYWVDFRTANVRFTGFPTVDRRGWSSTDRWFQIAPGGRSLAVWSKPTGLGVFSYGGADLLRRKDNVTAFRFAPGGDRIAVASGKGIEILSLDQRELRLLAGITGIDWLRWTDFGLVASRRSKLLLIDDAGKQRALVSLGPGAVATAKRRIVSFAAASMTELDLGSDQGPSVTKLADRDPVINAELSPDGANLLFATARRVYLREGARPVTVLAEIADVHSLFFSPDGSAYLWAADSGGAVVEKSKRTALPADVRSARFRQDGGSGLVLTKDDGVTTWNATASGRPLVGGISPDDGVNFAGDLVNGAEVVLFYKKTGNQKQHQLPPTPPF
jgi:hypothetical protein